MHRTQPNNLQPGSPVIPVTPGIIPGTNPVDTPQGPAPEQASASVTPVQPEKVGPEVFLRQTHGRLGEQIRQTEDAVADEVEARRRETERQKFGPRMSPYHFD